MREGAGKDCGQVFNVTKSNTFDSLGTLGASSKDLGLITSTGKLVERNSMDSLVLKCGKVVYTRS